MFDVFISYEHESKNIADNMVSVLERSSIRCWYAPRDVEGDYATAICNAINQVPIFVVIMNSNASNSPHVLNEVEMAYMRLEKKEIIILPFKASDEALSMAMEYYLKRLHWIDSTSEGLNDAINNLKNKILKILGRNEDGEKLSCGEKIENKYFDASDKNEVKRLELQAGIIQKFDQDVYDRCLKGRENLVCMDFGSNNGASIARRLLNREEVSTIIGLEFDEESVKRGNEKFKDTKLKLYQTDLEDSEIETTISSILEQNGCSKIDLVVCSFILMHMKNQKSLLKAIRKNLSSDGTLIIEDVDDNLYMAYPDDKGNFAKAIKLLRYNEFGGNRLNGRSLFLSLKKSGFKNIKIEHSGLNTINMDYEAREATFDMNFSYLEGDLEMMINKHPEDIKLKEDLKWWKENKDELEDKFVSDDFFFMDSTIVFSATKE